MKKVALISLGCAKNLVDSEVMLGFLQQSGYSIITDLEAAHIIILNTCGFIHPARQEAEDHIQDIIQIKAKSKKTKLVVAGCYVSKDSTALKSKYPEIDIWTGVNDFHHIVHLIEDKPYAEDNQCFLYDHASPRLISTPSTWAYVKISEGCSHTCSFCTIPKIKGPYHSREISSIKSEVLTLINQGILEINLVSQDSTFYGRDLGIKHGLAELLKTLVAIPNLDWIRFLYSYAEEVTDQLLDVMLDKKVCSYLDSPFQHADSKIIKNMRRGFDGPKALNFIHKLRHKIPDIAIRTSLIVGFPGEGRKEFQELKAFVKEAAFDHLGVFTYSPEKGTQSFHMPDSTSQEEKEARRQEIMEIQAAISRKNNKKYHKTSQEVLVEGHLQNDPKRLVGRTRYQAPEIDGVVFVDAPEDQDLHPGIYAVDIQGSNVYDLYGKFKK